MKTEQRAAVESIERPVVYPKNCVVGVMRSREAADGALAALVAEGFKASLYEGGESFSRPDEKVTPFRKAGRVLRSLVLEEDRWRTGYEEERRAGRDIVVVEIHGWEQARRAATVLATSTPRSVRSFGSWLITDLFPRSAVAQPMVTIPPVQDQVLFSTSVEALQSVDIFRTLSDAELQHVMAIGEGVSVPQGTLLAHQGEVGQSVYVITEGQVQLETATLRGEVTVRIAGAGESLPLAALLGSGRLITTAIAMTDVRAFEMRCAGFMDLARRRPEIGMKVYRAVADILGGRYSNTLTRLAGTLEQGLPQRPEIFANV